MAPASTDPAAAVREQLRVLVPRYFAVESPVHADGDMDVVTYYLTTVEHRDRGLVTFFERRAAELEAAMPRPKRKARRKPRTK